MANHPTQPDPTAQGLGINPDPPEKPRDVFDFVYREFFGEGTQHEDVAQERLVVESFIDKARTLFSENQVVGTDPLGTGLSLRFQDGSVSPFCDVPGGMDGVGGEAGSMPVARQHLPRGADSGKGKTTPSESWGVTKGEQPGS